MKLNKMKACKQLTLVAMLVAATGCTHNFIEYNTNPNEATENMADWDNVRTGSFLLTMEQNVLVVAQGSGSDAIGSDRYQTVEVMGGDGFVGYFGFAAPNINSAGRYNWNKRSWYGDMFTTNYTKTMNAWRELKKAVGNDSDPRCAMALILKVAAMHRVTDSYGPIPYTQFGVSKEVPYDSQKDVYYKFFEELTQAVNVLSDYAARGEKIFSSWDVVFNGDVKQWVKMANTLRLRLAMHIVYADPEKAKAEAEAACADANGFLSEKNDVAQLQHIYPIATYESPLYIIKGWQDVHMGATIDSYMNGYQDPRLAVYFSVASDGKYRGIRAGLPSSVKKESYTKGDFSEPNVNATSNVVWMRASESYFLRSEGALRGWNMGGTAQELYEQGIRMSFEEQGVSGADSYILQTADDGFVPADYEDTVTPSYSTDARGTVPVAWSTDGGFETNLEQIITQKYIALFPVGQEAWTEFRRTGYPKVFPVVTNENNSVDTETQIRRLPYPEKEYNTNVEQLNKGISLLGGSDNAGTRLWWDVKN